MRDDIFYHEKKIIKKLEEELEDAELRVRLLRIRDEKMRQVFSKAFNRFSSVQEYLDSNNKNIEHILEKIDKAQKTHYSEIQQEIYNISTTKERVYHLIKETMEERGLAPHEEDFFIGFFQKLEKIERELLSLLPNQQNTVNNIKGALK